MPPARRPAPAYPQTSRCRFRGREGRCRRVATVNGEFCRSCAAALELEMQETPAAHVFDVLDRALTGRLRRDEAAQLVGGLAGGFIGHLLGQRQAQRPRIGQIPPPRAHREPPRRPPPAPEPPPPDPTREARLILGFEPDERLTAEAVKDRRRALAKVFHPDTGASKAHMQRINAATDLLLSKL